MGCGASTSQGQPIRVTERTGGDDQPVALSERLASQQPMVSNERVDGPQINGNSTRHSKNAKKENIKPPLPGPKSVAFEVNLDNNGNNIDEKKVPSRIKTKLAPLVNPPKLTADMLGEKLQQAEQNRLKELEKKKEVSRRSSRLRRNIVQAREFEKAQVQYREIEDKQMSAGKNRESRLAALEEKKRAREERANRVKLRAKRLQQDGADDLGFEIEKDEDFNAGDDDSWLGDYDQSTDFHDDRGETIFSGNPSMPGIERVTSGTIRVTSGTEGRVPSGTERVYSGRESPSKRLNPRSSAELRARMSAGTTDSFDYAFQRVPVGSTSQPVNDDFFDT